MKENIRHYPTTDSRSSGILICPWLLVSGSHSCSQRLWVLQSYLTGLNDDSRLSSLAMRGGISHAIQHTSTIYPVSLVWWLGLTDGRTDIGSTPNDIHVLAKTIRVCKILGRY